MLSRKARPRSGGPSYAGSIFVERTVSNMNSHSLNVKRGEEVGEVGGYEDPSTTEREVSIEDLTDSAKGSLRGREEPSFAVDPHKE